MGASEILLTLSRRVALVRKFCATELGGLGEGAWGTRVAPEVNLIFEDISNSLYSFFFKKLLIKSFPTLTLL